MTITLGRRALIALCIAVWLAMGTFNYGWIMAFWAVPADQYRYSDGTCHDKGIATATFAGVVFAPITFTLSPFLSEFWHHGFRWSCHLSRQEDIR